MRMGCCPSRTNHMNSDLIDVQPRIPFLKQEIHTSDCITCMDISEDLSLLVLGTESGILHTFSTMSQKVEDLGELRGHKSGITCCCLYGQSIFSGSSDCFIVKWSLLTMSMMYVYRGHDSKINSIICAGDFLFSSSYDRSAKGWKISLPPDPREENRETGMQVEARSERRIDSFCEKKRDVNQDALCVCTYSGHEKGVYPLAFIPADDDYDLDHDLREIDLLVTGSADCTARIWCASSGECRHVLLGHTSPIHAIAIDYSNENIIMTGGGDGLILSFCSITGDRLRSLYGHEAAILRFDTHKNMLFSASADKTARAWVMEFGEETRVFRGSRAPVTCVRYFNGFVITGSEDGTCRLFDSKSGSLMRTFRHETSPIVQLWNVPGKLFAAHQNGSLIVWDCTGIRDETVFADDEQDRNSSISSEWPDVTQDSEEVEQAVRILEKYLDQR